MFRTLNEFCPSLSPQQLQHEAGARRVVGGGRPEADQDPAGRDPGGAWLAQQSWLPAGLAATRLRTRLRLLVVQGACCASAACPPLVTGLLYVTPPVNVLHPVHAGPLPQRGLGVSTTAPHSASPEQSQAAFFSLPHPMCTPSRAACPCRRPAPRLAANPSAAPLYDPLQ